MATKAIAIQDDSVASTFASAIEISKNTSSSSEVTGALTIVGGMSTQNNVSVGGTLNIKGGANGRTGTGTLAGGFSTIANNTITANSRILITVDVNGGPTVGDVGEEFDDRVVGVSFTIRSSNLLDNRRFAYFIFEQI